MTESSTAPAPSLSSSAASPPDDILIAVLDEMRRVARDNDIELSPAFEDASAPLDLALLESGLDSIGFATVVALLEERLGYDPFLLSDEPIYPTTLGEFVAIYRDAQPD